MPALASRRVSTRSILTTATDYPTCDICGRTLLRGEHISTYLNGGARRSVCELCDTRALHEGWMREGSAAAFESSRSAGDRRRSLLGRLRSRQGLSTAESAAEEDRSGRARVAPPVAESPLVTNAARPVRSVHAVPANDEHRAASAVALFNRSEHRRTVSGVARSLGAPAVHVAAVDGRPSLVTIVVSWELCWYRYEVDLSDDGTSVRVTNQGYELEDLDERERIPNATADELGQLSLTP